MRAWRHTLAATLLPAAPLVAFLAANHYPAATPETALLLAGCVALGALLGYISSRATWLTVLVFGAGAALCLDLLYHPDFAETGLALLLLACLAVAAALRQHLATVLAAAASVFIAATLLVPSAGARPDAGLAGGAAPARPPVGNLPVILHLILDEHIGIDGLPRDVPGSADLARWLSDSYVRQGFRLHADAHSEYVDTRNSIANLLNFTSEDGDWAHLAEGKRKPYVLTESAYFRTLSERGYRLHVYQSDYLDYCRVSGVSYAACTSYRANSIASLPAESLGVLERARFILNSLVGTSRYVERLRDKYRELRAEVPSLPLPAWGTGVNRVGPLAVLPVVRQLENDLRTATRGDAFFAHLLIPHYPYVLDDACHIRKIAQWLYNDDPAALSELEPNSAATRAARYRNYFAQIRCQQRLLNGLFEAMRDAGVWNDAIVIVHGDHGSRIMRRLPVMQNAARLTAEDLSDGFSTLFAAKLPGQAAGVVRDASSLQELLSEALGLARPPGAPKVLLRTEDGKTHRAFRLSQLRAHLVAD